MRMCSANTIMGLETFYLIAILKNIKIFKFAIMANISDHKIYIHKRLSITITSIQIITSKK